MTNSMICTNPSCGKRIEYPENAFQVICSYCNTWHLAPEGGVVSENSNANNFEPDNGYLPEPEFDAYNLPEKQSVPEQITIEEEAVSELVQEVAQTHIGYIITEQGKKFTLKEGKNLIGRKNADIVIADQTISRRHCCIEVTVAEDHTTEYFIYDIGHIEGQSSLNGVFISGRSLRIQDYERVPLPDGVTVRIGNVSFQVKHN